MHHAQSDVLTGASAGITIHTGLGCSSVGNPSGVLSCTLYGSWGHRNLEKRKYWQVGIAGYDPLQGTLTDHCVRLSKASSTEGGSPSWTEREGVILGTF